MSLFFHIEASVQTLKDLCRKQLCLLHDSIILVYDFKPVGHSMTQWIKVPATNPDTYRRRETNSPKLSCNLHLHIVAFLCYDLHVRMHVHTHIYLHILTCSIHTMIIKIKASGGACL